MVHRRVDFKIKNNFLSKLKYKKANKIIAVSNQIKEILINSQIETQKIEVIHDSSPTTLNITRNFSKEKIKIGSLIALVPHKDPFNLIKAAKICIEKNKNLEFLVGGSGPLEGECKNLIKELKIEDSFKFLGYIEDNISFLKEIDIFVLPSKEEGLGSVLLEAMALKLPIVATDAGGISDLIKNNYNGFLVPKQDPKKLAEAILKLIENRELMETFSKNGFEFVKDFTSDKMAQKTLEIYEKL